MSNGLLAALMLIVGVVAGALIAVAAYAPELRRIARFLERRSTDKGGDGRVTVNTRAPGISDLAAAINDELDRSAVARIGAMRHQQEFQRDLSALSHDIRTPLTGAKGYLQLASDESDPKLRQHRLDAAVERIDRTSELLDALFSYTKASDPDLELDLAPVDVRDVVERCLLAHYPEFEARAWEPRLEGSGAARIVEADRQALERIVENLVVNALRHGAKAPRISLGGPNGNSTLLRLSNSVDDSESIDPERLFDRFYRADEARTGGGSGLGLATAAKLARAMGMELAARIEGETLTIELSVRSGIGCA